MCALNKSPALKCVNPKSRTMFAHCVPLPAPGPPKTNTTVGLVVEVLSADEGAAGASATAPSAHITFAVGANVAKVAAANPNATGVRAAVREVTASDAAERVKTWVSHAAVYAREAEAACVRARREREMGTERPERGQKNVTACDQMPYRRYGRGGTDKNNVDSQNVPPRYGARRGAATDGRACQRRGDERCER